MRLVCRPYFEELRLPFLWDSVSQSVVPRLPVSSGKTLKMPIIRLHLTSTKSEPQGWGRAGREKVSCVLTSSPDDPMHTCLRTTVLGSMPETLTLNCFISLSSLHGFSRAFYAFLCWSTLDTYCLTVCSSAFIPNWRKKSVIVGS